MLDSFHPLLYILPTYSSVDPKNHQRFFEDKGGKVFFIFSVKSTGKKKKIFNVEVIEEIKTEIARLESSN